MADQVDRQVSPLPAVLVLVAAALAVLGAVLPWVTVSTIFGTLSKSGVDGDGRATIIGGVFLGVIAAVVLATKKRSRAGAVLAIVIGAGIFLVGLIDAKDVSDRVADLGAVTGVASAQVGIGLWMTCLAGLVGLAGGIGSAANLR